MALVPLGAADGRSAWLVEGAGRTLAVFRCDDGVHVTDAACPHGGGPLVEGDLVDGHIVVCPWHFLRFDLRTGRCVPNGMHRLRRYPVVDRDGELFAETPDEPCRGFDRQDVVRVAAGRDTPRAEKLPEVSADRTGEC